LFTLKLHNSSSITLVHIETSQFIHLNWNFTKRARESKHTFQNHKLNNHALSLLLDLAFAANLSRQWYYSTFTFFVSVTVKYFNEFHCYERFKLYNNYELIARCCLHFSISGLSSSKLREFFPFPFVDRIKLCRKLWRALRTFISFLNLKMLLQKMRVTNHYRLGCTCLFILCLSSKQMQLLWC